MSTLTIRDLAHHAEMDRSEMSAVRGGYNFAFPNYKSSFDLSASVQQLAQQTQNTFNQNGNNVAFSHDISSDVDPVQKAKNNSNINVFSGGGLVRA